MNTTDIRKNEVVIDLEKYNDLQEKVRDLELALNTGEPASYYERGKQLASVIDRFRIIPRIFITAYMYLCYLTVSWFMSLDAPTIEQAGLISVVVGGSAAWFNFYTSSRVAE